MPSNNIIHLQTLRLQVMQRDLKTPLSHPGLPQKSSAKASSEPMSGYVATVVGIIIRLTKTSGRNYEKLPTFVRSALDDHCAEGNSTCRLIRSWLLDVALADQPEVDNQTDAGPMDRVFRHNRFWRPGSQFLEQADKRRQEKLMAFFDELEAGD